MLTNSQFSLIKLWAEENGFTPDVRLRFTQSTGGGWSVYRSELENPGSTKISLGFDGELPDGIDTSRIYTPVLLATMTETRDHAIKSAFIKYLESATGERFFQAIINFTRGYTNLDCWSMRICKDPDEPIGLDAFFLEGDEHFNAD